jgi:hypothetical protein
MISALRGKRRLSIFACVLLAALALVFTACAGRMLVVDAPERSDVIVVLAGETDHRPARGLQLLDEGYGRRVFLDVPAGAEIFGFEVQQLATKYALDRPEAASVRVCPIFGLSTRDESHDAAKCLAEVEGRRILIVTSDFHTRRALSIFRHEVHSKTFSIAAVHDDRQFGTRWWRHRQWAKTCLDEWLRLLWWNAVDQWR